MRPSQRYIEKINRLVILTPLVDKATKCLATAEGLIKINRLLDLEC